MVLAISMTSTIAFDRAAALIVGLLRSNRFILVESKGVMVSEVGAGDGGGLDVDLGVQALELARMAFNCTHMGGDLGCILVVDHAQLERVSVVRASVVVVRVHWLAMRGMCDAASAWSGFWMAVVMWNSY